MNSLLRKKPFYEQIEFCGSIKAGSAEARDLHMILEYPEAKPGKISGKIIGLQSHFDEIANVVNHRNPYCTLESKVDVNNPQVITSGNLVISDLTTNSWYPGYTEHMLSSLGSFELYDLTIKHSFERQQSKPRKFTFYLAGPSTFWNIFRPIDFNEDNRLFYKEVEGHKMEFDLDFPVKVEIKPDYLFYKPEESEKVVHETHVFTLTVKCEENESVISSTELVNKITEFVDDLIILVSFASGSLIRWYIREFRDFDSHTRFVRAETRSFVDMVRRHEMLVDPTQADSYVKTCLGNYRQLKSQNFSLFYPILNFLAGCNSSFMEEGFTHYFFALEKIKDLYAQKTSQEKILKEKEFKTLYLLLLNVITSSVTEEVKCNQIENKIIELNRPPLRDVIELMFKEYEVPWQDLYPPDHPLSIINTRSKLFHSAEILDVDKLGDETDRLKAIVARLILKILGWNYISHIPRKEVADYLRTLKE